MPPLLLQASIIADERPIPTGDPDAAMSNPHPPPTNDRPAPRPQPNNPLHGITLEAILTALVAHYGWEEMAERIRLRCFAHEPSLTSSLKFLRKTPWARAKVEGLYLFMLREQRRRQAWRAGTGLSVDLLRPQESPKPPSENDQDQADRE